MQGLGGYLMPQASDVEWRLSEEDSDEYYLKMIHEISDATKDYVLPFLNKYSNLREYTYGVEMGLFKHTTYDYKTPPIAYYLLGEKDNALRYIDQMLNLYAHRIESEKKKYELIEKDSFREEVFYCGYNRDYDNYKEFADKFIKYMEEKDKQL